MPFRVLAGALGLFFFVQGANWLINPAGAAQGLGMPLLEGIARSSQVGDTASFFLCLGAFGMFGAYRMQPTWLRASGCLVGLVAITRTIAWAFHGAEFTTAFVVIELVTSGLFLLSASKLEGVGDQ
jgi:hypothetical protein